MKLLCSPRRSVLVLLEIVFVVAALVVLPASQAHAADRYVSLLGNDGNPGTELSLYRHVQWAIDQSSSGDHVHVGVGTFVEDIMMEPGVSLYGSGPVASILEGTGTMPVVTADGIGGDTTIDGFAIEATASPGGGILCSNASSLTINYNYIKKSTGGGINCYNGSSPTITYSTIERNSGGGINCYSSSPIVKTRNNIIFNTGGGINCYSNSSPTITFNAITGNTASTWSGGGINCSGFSTATITFNTITKNSAVGGGGIFCSNSSPTITRNIIGENLAGSYGGAGILCSNSSSPSITYNDISANTASYYGGGIYCVESSSLIASNTITGNAAKDFGGGGIACYKSSPAITRNTLSANTAENYGGGGILCYGSSSPTIDANDVMSNIAANYGGGGIACDDFSKPPITNNVITLNTASGWGGGGIYCGPTASPDIINNTITKNSARKGGGIYAEDKSPTPPTPTIKNCILWDNLNDLQIVDDLYGCSATYSNISTSADKAGTGNISLDPGFVGALASPPDYHLKNGSPCIGQATSVGAPSRDRDDVARAGRYDMGAYQWVVTYSLTYAAGTGGTVEGISPQTVSPGGSGTQVRALPALGYDFVEWDDTQDTDPVRIDSDVNHDINAVAIFVAKGPYTLKYTAGTGGTIVGSALQTVDWMGSGTSVTASANAGYTFVDWSDGKVANPRTDVEIVTDVNVTANFLAGNYTTVYRFYNSKQAVHFYTADEAEKQKIIDTLSDTYRSEGVAYQINNDNPLNNQPLYRFYNMKKGVHFYTASETEKDATIANLSSTYKFEGVAFKVSMSPAGSTPVWRFFNMKQGVHFYTASATEKDSTIKNLSATYKFEGPGFWLAP